MTSSQELVSVVIPTRNRPDLILRAVRSALAQTYPAVEVIVVIDGPDPATNARLTEIADPRLVVVPLDRNRGAADARNLGVELAKGDWIAFLDDDDEWMAGKIAFQMAARPAGVRYPIMSCRSKVVTARGDFEWPRRLCTAQDSIGDYLFIRHGLFKGETFAPTTTLLAPRALLRLQPIPVSMFDDWEWLIKCACIEGTAMVTVPEVLAVHYTETDRITLSTCHDIEPALRWSIAMRPHLSPRAYASLLLQATGGEQEARTTAVRRRILAEALRHGTPTPMALATFLMHSVMPVALRRRLRRAVYSAPRAA